jgi:hypothetical protein
MALITVRFNNVLIEWHASDDADKQRYTREVMR